MFDELHSARLAGRSYEDIHEDVVKLVNYFTNLWYKNYPVLKNYGIEKEDIVMDVYRGLCLRTKDDGLSNLERHFIKASKIENCTMSYISNLIRMSVSMSLRCCSREAVKKPRCISLDDVVYQNGEKDMTLSELVQDNKEPIEDYVSLKLSIESIKHKKYKEYYTVTFFGDKKYLSTREVLDWIVSGYTISEMCEKVYNKDGKNIDYKKMSEIRRETIQQAREAFN